jgi:hypothetical protein
MRWPTPTHFDKILDKWNRWSYPSPICNVPTNSAAVGANATTATMSPEAGHRILHRCFKLALRVRGIRSKHLNPLGSRTL